MNWEQTLEYLYSALPVFHRIGPAALKPGLDNTLALCKILSNPEKKFRSIHVAGTNGKGSTSHILASILQEAGYKVGLYTSPHLKDFRERIKVNGKMISKEEVIDFTQNNKNIFEQLKPSFFEMTVALAFNHFAKQKVDVAVVEVGLGGRLDSTNVLEPDLSIITNISFDHTELLGNTVRKIAVEKAGIIKRSGMVVIGDRGQGSGVRGQGTGNRPAKQSKARFGANVFNRKAKAMGSRIAFAEDAFALKNLRQIMLERKQFLEFDLGVKGAKNVFIKKLRCDLPGLYQAENIRTALLAIELLKSYRGYEISWKSIGQGLENVRKNTGMMGRWQILKQQPLVICDVAHNEAGIMEVGKMLKKISFKRLHIVFGTVSDKDPKKVLKVLPKKALYYFCKSDLPRSLDPEILQKKAVSQGLKGGSYSSVKSAYKAALSNADKNDLVLVIGSVFVVAEVL